MIVAAARVEPFALALRRPLATARGAIAERRGFLLHVASRDGIAGCGEASPAYWLGEGSLAATAAGLERIMRRLRTRPPLAVLRDALDAEALGVPPAAACALDGALLDLEGRERGRAVAALFGADPAATVAVAALVGGPTAAAAADEAAAAAARGFGAVKLKVGAAALVDDVACVAAVRARVGADVRLRLDANRAWTLGEAARALAAFEPYGVEYVEEPMRAFDPAALAALARETPVPLAVDESLRSAGDVVRLAAAGARVHVVLKAARLGGPSRVVAIADEATRAGLPVVVTDAIESGVGMRIAAHVAAVCAARGAAPSAVGLGGAQLAPGEEALRVPALRVDGPGFAVTPAEAPGVGDEALRG
ncbi:MAG: o-succinylbenzoate synthase [Deltaproteobacteria bacterium]|nr:o-succinylbenzoate synthase [Deltaproteobacteria bacterium]